MVLNYCLHVQHQLTARRVDLHIVMVRDTNIDMRVANGCKYVKLLLLAQTHILAETEGVDEAYYFAAADVETTAFEL